MQNYFVLSFDLCLYSSEAILSKSLVERVCWCQRFRQENVLFYLFLLQFRHKLCYCPGDIYLLKFSNGNTRTICKICLILTI